MPGFLAATRDWFKVYKVCQLSQKRFFVHGYNVFRLNFKCFLVQALQGVATSHHLHRTYFPLYILRAYLYPILILTLIYYQVADGKPVNEFAFNGEFQNREFAVGVIEETHGYWKKLVEQGHNGLSTCVVGDGGDKLMLE